jgi:capsular polysaccharide biosynthesis protein
MFERLFTGGAAPGRAADCFGRAVRLVELLGVLTMTSSTLPEPTPPTTPTTPTWVDDEIDLRAYLLILIAWWREIALITAVVAVVAVAASWYWVNAQATRYEASADVVIARLISQYNIDERIATTTETQGIATASWRVSLLQLAHSPALAEAVLVELGHALPEGLRTPGALASVVQATTPASEDGRTLADIVRISAITESPELAMQIANAWANHFIAHINRVYGEIPTETINAVTEDQADAKARFDQAQQALQTFITESNVATLQREIDALAAALTALQTANTTLLTAVSSESYTTAAGLVAAANDGRIQRFAQLYARRNTALAQLDQATQLAAQLELGGDAAAASSAQALQLLKNQVFAPDTSGAALPTIVSLPVATPSATADADALLLDVQALVTVLTAYVTELNAAIDEYLAEQAAEPVAPTTVASQMTLTGTTAAAGISAIAGYDAYLASQAKLLELDARLQVLRGQLEAERSRERELTQQRDLAWTAYDALSNKLVELNLARTAANSEVRLGSAAVVPSKPVAPPSLRLPVAAATAAAFFGAILLAFTVNTLGGKPFLARRSPREAL